MTRQFLQVVVPENMDLKDKMSLSQAVAGHIEFMLGI